MIVGRKLDSDKILYIYNIGLLESRGGEGWQYCIVPQNFSSAIDFLEKLDSDKKALPIYHNKIRDGLNLTQDLPSLTQLIVETPAQWASRNT